MINYHVYLKNVSKTFLHEDNYPTATNYQNLFFTSAIQSKISGMFNNSEIC